MRSVSAQPCRDTVTMYILHLVPLVWVGGWRVGG
jgi:hypothetical protein